MAELMGRRVADTVEGILPSEFSWNASCVGIYWKLLDGSGKPIIKSYPGKLTEECWRVVVPIGDEDGYAIANLDHHTVREHEDGTISVIPNDGSSNSILVHGSRGRSWHGFIDHGKLYE